MGKLSLAFVLLAAVLLSVHVNAISFTFYRDQNGTSIKTVNASCTVFPWSLTMGGCNSSAITSGRVNCSIYSLPNATSMTGMNRTAGSDGFCSLPSYVNISTIFIRPNFGTFVGSANNVTSWTALTLYNFGIRNPPTFEDFRFFYWDITVDGCIGESDVVPGQFLVPGTSNTSSPKGMVLISIMTQSKCNLEKLIPAVEKGGGVGIVMCEPSFSKEACGYNYYQHNQYGDHEKFKQKLFVFIMCEATAVCGIAKGQVRYVNASAGNVLQPRPALIKIWADLNTYLNPTNYWLEGEYFIFVRVILPIYGYCLSAFAGYRLYRFIRQQGGLKANSLAQWSMFFEMIANFCRATRFATFTLYLTLEGGYGFLACSEGLVMCNMILAAVFWGTLDVNSSPLYRFRYLCGFLCVSFFSVTIAIAALTVKDVQTYAPIMTHWTYYNECAIGCVVFLFVPRRLYQLSKYQLMQQEIETKPAEAGAEAIKAAEEQADEEDDEEAMAQQQSAEANAVGVAGSTNTTAVAAPAKTVGHKRRPPIVMKMLYWSCLISIFCIVSIVQLVLVTIWEDIPQANRYLQDNWYFFQRATGICGYLMTTSQLLMYTPKKVRRPGQGSTAGSMTNPKTNTSTM